MNISLRHLEVFRAVMSSGSVSAAAVLLSTSQPTMSRELARMEYLLGYALFDRLRGRLLPTARARALYDEVQRAYVGLAHIQTAAARLAALDEGLISVVCQPAFAESLLPGACKRFAAKHAKVRISITPQESPILEEWLSAQRFDMGLTELAIAPPGTLLTQLLRVDEVCVLPHGHPLCSRPRVTLPNFAGQSFISLSATDPYRIQLDAMFSQYGVARELRIETHSAASVCALVAQGLGIAIVNPLSALALQGTGIVLRRLGVSVPFNVSLVRPEHRASNPLVDVFADALRAQANSIKKQLGLALG